MAQATSAGHVTFWSAASGATTFSLNSMPALLQGLQACTADLMQYWNQGGENDGRIMEPATGNVRAAFSARDFPQEAMSRQQEGTAQFLLLIDETGAVAGCHAVKTSGIPVFDAMGCQVLRERAKFTPARDGTGKPVRSMVTTPSVTWRLGY
jgi:TonB family protein